MSSFETLVFPMAWLMFNLFVVVFLLRATLTLSGVIQTGLLDGAPVAIEFRRRLLWSWLFGIHLAATVAQALGALVLIQIGANVDDTKVQGLAYHFAHLRKEEELSDA